VDRRWPWLKWLIIAPIVVEALGTAIYTVGLAEGVQVLASIRAWLLPLNQAALLLQMVAVSCFFFSVGTKIGQASSADARRHLKLLINGTSLALTPLFLLAVYGLIRGFEKIPERDIGFPLFCRWRCSLSRWRTSLWCSARWMYGWSSGRGCDMHWRTAVYACCRS
jgi:hypothetical protein